MTKRNLSGWIVTFAMMTLAPSWAPAQATYTVVPGNGQSVSPNGPVVFTFSEPILKDPDFTTIDFYDISNPFATLPVSLAWDSSDKVLTCTPNPPFPANKMIFWSLTAETVSGATLEGELGGYFNTTSGGGGGSGSGTNRVTTFSVLSVHSYEQTNSAGPSLQPEFSYGLFASTDLASNRTALDISMKLPTGTTNSLTPLFGHPEDYNFFGYETNLNIFNATYPGGAYTFFVHSSTSNETVALTLPEASQQPNAPAVLNSSTLTNADASQPVAINWGAFQGGTSADFISVDIITVTNSPRPGESGALNGTANSWTVPAGLLKPNTNYDVSIGFYRGAFTTNSTESRGAFRATTTSFTLTTSSGGSPSGPLVVTNATWTPAAFVFDVTCSPGLVSIEASSDLSPNNWQKVYTTNAPGTRVSIAIPVNPAEDKRFYRARNGG